MKCSSLLMACLLFGVTALPLSAAPVFVPKSSVTITFREMGLAIAAPFTRFSANIDFDVTHPQEASARFEIDVSSLDLGSPEYTKAVLQPEWFDAADFPVASFASTSLKEITPTVLEATGRLTIKGQTQVVSFPVIIQDVGALRAYDGVVHISRLAFGVGTGEWLETTLVADEVIIAVHAVAERDRRP